MPPPTQFGRKRGLTIFIRQALPSACSIIVVIWSQASFCVRSHSIHKSQVADIDDNYSSWIVCWLEHARFIRQCKYATTQCSGKYGLTISIRHALLVCRYAQLLQFVYKYSCKYSHSIHKRLTKIHTCRQYLFVRDWLFAWAYHTQHTAHHNTQTSRTRRHSHIHTLAHTRLIAVFIRLVRGVMTILFVRCLMVRESMTIIFVGLNICILLTARRLCEEIKEKLNEVEGIRAFIMSCQ